MKKILIGILFLATLLYSETLSPNKDKTISKNLSEICIDSKAFEIQRRGCCSWHDGVSGCSGGRVTCNDGTYSPSCTCYVPITPLG